MKQVVVNWIMHLMTGREQWMCCSALRMFPVTRVDPCEHFLRNNFTEKFYYFCFNLEVARQTIPIPTTVTCAPLVGRYAQV